MFSASFRRSSVSRISAHATRRIARMASPRAPMPLLPTKRGVRHARHVDVVRREVEEERLGLVLLDEIDGLAGDRVGHVLVHPAGGLAAAHVADAADAVDDGHVVAVAGLHLEQLRMILAGRLVADRFARS